MAAATQRQWLLKLVQKLLLRGVSSCRMFSTIVLSTSLVRFSDRISELVASENSVAVKPFTEIGFHVSQVSRV